MTEMRAYFTAQIDRDPNVIGTYTDGEGRTVVLVLDNSETALAPHALRAGDVRRGHLRRIV